MRNVLKLVFWSLLIVGCSPHPKPSNESIAVLEQFSSNFCLLDHSLDRQLENIDSNTFIYCKEDLYAQSYILVIKRNRDVMRGLYQEFDLSSVGLSAAHKSHGIFFKGFSFEVDPLMWKEIKEESLRIVEKSDPDHYNEEILDGVPYLLLYNGKEFLANESRSKKICDDLNHYINERIVAPLKYERDSLPR